MQNQTNTPTRLATIRRLYFYLVAFISLLIILSALDGLLNTLDEVWLSGWVDDAQLTVNGGSFIRNAIARSGGLLLVATPIFLIHWGVVRRSVTGQNQPSINDERRSTLRKLFLYLASAVALGYVLVYTYEVIHELIALALGINIAQSELWPTGWLHTLLIILLASGLLTYLTSTIRSDGDYGTEVGYAANVRQLYQTIAGLVGLVLMIAGIGGILEVVWQWVTGQWAEGIGDAYWRNQLSDAGAMLFVGALLARSNWNRWQAIVAQNPSEVSAALRRLYLYAAVIISALVTLVPAANLLREFLLLAFGTTTTTSSELLANLTTPIAYTPVGILAWRWHWRLLQQESEKIDETKDAATVRRIYYYAVSATGLALLWVGSVEILRSMLDVLFASGDLWEEPLANGLSLLAVGAPVWSLHWQAVQRVARQDSAEGGQERSSMPRRVYLYGVALVGALLILFYLASVIYRVLLLLLGDPDPQLFSIQTVDDIARSVIAAVLWSVHVWAIRTDSQLGEHDEEETDVSVAPADKAAQREQLIQQIAMLEAELMAAKEYLLALDKPDV
ncbi:MAG: DUF5671 domain-containing protein [Chloroflexota bacterium]